MFRLIARQRCLPVIRPVRFFSATFGDGSGKPQRSPIDIYKYLLKAKRVTYDARQEAVVQQMHDQLYNQLHSRLPALHQRLQSPTPAAKPEPKKEESSSLFSNFFSSSSKPKSVATPSPQAHVSANIPGFYLYGPPGSGKTLLMDLMYRCAPLGMKRRTHFTSFMLSDVHQRIFKWRQQNEGDPLPALADSIAKESLFICFDEFQVTDVADAMILGRLFKLLWQRGVVFMMTSNRPPDDLYKNGVQRNLFVPFIVELKQKNKVVPLDNSIDYRTKGNYLKNTFFSPCGEDKVDNEFQELFEKIIDEPVQPRKLKVAQGRDLLIRKTAGQVAYITFDELCTTTLGAADYQAISNSFETVFIQGVPKLTLEQNNALRRFITAIDELYQMRVRVIISAESEVSSLLDIPDKDSLPNDEIFAFDRCASRLTEMQSKEYLDQAVLKHGFATHTHTHFTN